MAKKSPVWSDDHTPYGTGTPGTATDWRHAYEEVMSEDEADSILQGNLQSPHQILGLLGPTNNEQMIKRAFRKIVKDECRAAFASNPDPRVEARFKEVHAAYSKMMSGAS
tara:strand:+ start:3175 stop:3504 length:330 start_codon:yes stop_codon:yes gene_type:complete